MTQDYLLDAINEISDQYVEEAIAFQKKRNKPLWIGIPIVAACLLLFFIIAPSTLLTQNDRRIITHFRSSDNPFVEIKAGYVAPNPGEIGYEINVNVARKNLKDKDVAYLLTFDLFSTSAHLLTEMQKEKEYERLTGLGYELFKTEYWTYYGVREMKYIPIIVGLFTEEQLINFPVNPQYGYFFRFVNNGDSSPLNFDVENAVPYHSKY